MSIKIIRKIIKFIVNIIQPVIHYSMWWDLFCPPTKSVPSEIVFDKYLTGNIVTAKGQRNFTLAIMPMQKNRQRR
jgi:hypothetical protein